MTLGERLSRTASEHPGRTALIFGGRRMSYRDLEDKAVRLASGLSSLGVRAGDRVALLMGNSPEFVVAYFGVAKAGAAVVPMNTFLAAPELAFILRHSGCLVLVTGPEFSGLMPALREGAPGLKHVVTAGGAGVAGRAGRPLPGAIEMEDLMREGASASPIEGVGSEGDPAAVLYTSGTTGRPKGAVLTHGNLLSNAGALALSFRVTKRDRFLLFLPMFHAFSFLVCLLVPISTGASVIILPSIKPFSKVLKAVVFGRASFFVAIPQVYNILAMKSFPKLLMRLLPLRLCVCGAAPLPAETLTRFAERFPFPLIEGYGLTEASPVVSCNPLSGKRKPGSAGLPIPGVTVRVVDESGSGLPAGEVGEIVVSGPNVMQGYLNDDAATRDAIRDGWLYTGDMGMLDREGYIYIVDRKKDLILVHGMNVYPREVEEVLYRHPAVAEAAVVGIPDEHMGEMPKAFITLKEGGRLTEKEVREYLKGRLASYKIPRRVEFLDKMPMTRTGKVLKRELRERTGL